MRPIRIMAFATIIVSSFISVHTEVFADRNQELRTERGRPIFTPWCREGNGGAVMGPTEGAQQCLTECLQYLAPEDYRAYMHFCVEGYGSRRDCDDAMGRLDGLATSCLYDIPIRLSGGRVMGSCCKRGGDGFAGTPPRGRGPKAEHS